MYQTTSTSIPREHGNEVSNGFASVPDEFEDQPEIPSMGEKTAKHVGEVGLVTTGGGNDYQFRFDHILRGPSISNTEHIRESLLSSHGGSEHASNTSTSHYDVNIQNALEPAMNVVKGLMLQKLVGHALSEAMDATGSSASPSRGSGGANAIFSLQFPKDTARNNGGKRARGGGHDPDGDGGDDSDEDDDNNRPKKKGPSHRIPQRRLKCPFYQRQPEKYTKAACQGEGFADMGKLKDHLKRVHMHPLRCPRCHVEMSEEELEAHLIMDVACITRPAPRDDRIAPHTLSKLDFKKAPFVNARDTEDKWTMLYKMLFPADADEAIPSPYNRNKLSPDLARALSEALEEELSKELAQFMEPIVTRMKARIPAIIERCRANLTIRTIDTNEKTPLPELSESLCVASEPRKLRKKSKFSVQYLNNSSEVFLQPVVTVGEVKRKQPQYSPVPQMTPSGSSEGSEETPPASASASTDKISHMDNLGKMHCYEPTVSITEVGDWNLLDSASVPLHPALDTTMLDFGLPPPCQGIEEQNPALRPYHNDLYLYGDSAFDIDGMQDWSNMATMNRKGLDEYPPAPDQLLNEEHLSMKASNWQVTAPHHLSQPGPS
ncbi:hypothetical protein P171DRAFT_483180 [Karstenula rhodostoma CBS 690.94]|uniref:C2H2-type domain-containing protein n=1 Tax=Karstenula rhodostoma CBS 690.94 TaxID=1392251 RepID=A0A9P4UF50_9PLEO|nr:hypothetical protein P171DRAFT_483180 [Karstenula rhodostoma CBS 690.94]